jgi:3-methylcrotonyl-CoA carboxylase alpha subunit
LPTRRTRSAIPSSSRRSPAAADFADSLASCQREAASSFGNAHVLIEKYIQRPRHIEVQVFGDSHGNVVHLFERDCSLQRRHQKVIEEAPAPGMDAATREELCCAAVRAAKAVDYVGAGTIEFIADASEGLRADRIWFMEMNTRLQVEHPVTEEITGVDLVEWQLRVASGEPLPLRQDELSINGWAMEARLYAEDPGRGFLPSTGRLEHFDLGELGRIETGVEEGDMISPFYDPMIAKLVAHGPTRAEAIANIAETLSTIEVWPVRTNAGFLLNAVLDDEFSAGSVDTGLIPRKLDTLVPGVDPDEAIWRGAADVALAGAQEEFGDLAGFRLNAAARDTVALARDGVFQRAGGPGAFAAVSGFSDDERVVVFYEGESYEFASSARGTGHAHSGDGSILSPMPGKIIAVEVTRGQTVTKGQKLLTLEAMKMEHSLVAPFDGVVAELNATTGAQVQVEAVLAKIEPATEQ